MMSMKSIVLFLVCVTSFTYSFKFVPKSFLQKVILPFALSTQSLVLLPTSTSFLHPQVVHADDTAVTQKPRIYFGVGCFWHVQHEFVEAEKAILGRSDNELTSFAGYAGGKNNKAVCYHNLMGQDDYGSLGHGEVVGMSIPDASVADFAKVYFNLFGADRERPDKGDRGPEYRSLLGLPGGIQSDLFPAVAAAAKEKGIQLVEGKGNDADTLGKKMVWVMDTNNHPFYQAEVYHQFHDGFMPGEQYSQSYNSLAKAAFTEKRIGFTGCPDSNP